MSFENGHYLEICIDTEKHRQHGVIFKIMKALGIIYNEINLEYKAFIYYMITTKYQYIEDISYRCKADHFA